MRLNKNAIARYRVLDKCFRNPGKHYYILDLIEEVSTVLYEMSDLSNGISRRQLYDDINFMKSPQGWNAPIESYRDGQRVYYCYSDFNFSIDTQPINEIEQVQLKEALYTLSRFKGLPQFEWIEEITTRIDSGLHLSSQKKGIIQFDQNFYLKGLGLITPIYNAIVYERVVQIEYISFKQEKKQSFIIHSYFLKQYNNRWYVFGLNDESDRIINLALDRIVNIEELNLAYKKNDKIDFNEYFEDIIGVSVDSNLTVTKILISVENDLLPYITTKPIHGSQKIKEKHNDYTLISLDLIPNYELESVLLSHGEKLTVLEPENLKNKMAERSKLLNNNYKK